jgi:hypothetical protein
VDDLDATNVFEKKVFPQLKYNNKALERTIMRGKVRIPGGYEFPVDMDRMNAFFDCLTHGIISKKINKKINLNSYYVRHMYRDLNHKFSDDAKKRQHDLIAKYMDGMIIGDVLSPISFSFADRKLDNQEIYNVKILGADSLIDGEEFSASLTVVHTFYNKFKVVSLLTRIANFERTPVFITRDPA